MSETESEQVSVVGSEQASVQVLVEAWPLALVTVSEQVSVVVSEQGSEPALVEAWASAIVTVSEQVSRTVSEQVSAAVSETESEQGWVHL